MNLIEENMFGGKKAEQYNVLMQTLKNCAKQDERSIYEYLDKTPKTSLIVELVDEINRLGFRIKSKKIVPGPPAPSKECRENRQREYS